MNQYLHYIIQVLILIRASPLYAWEFTARYQKKTYFFEEVCNWAVLNFYLTGYPVRGKYLRSY